MEVEKDEKQRQKTAIIFGSTGLVGGYLLELLCESNRYRKVLSFSRRASGFTHPKLKEHISTLNSLDDISNKIVGDDLYCCLGTTIKKAGNKESFTRIDFTLPVQLANIAEKNKVQSFSVVSSVGANPNSSNFYLSTKGQMENRVLQCDIPNISILRPSMLLGPRDEFRFGETAGKLLMSLANPLMMGKFKKYRGIRAISVAKAMLTITTNETKGKEIYESDELQQIADNL